MKILFALECASLQTNGTTATCLRFASELRKRGHEVKILGVGGENTKNDPNYIELKKFHFPFFQWIIDKEGFVYAKLEYDIIYEAVKWCDIVHFFLPYSFGNGCRLIAETLGKPVTGAFHVAPENITAGLRIKWFEPLNRLLYVAFRDIVYRNVKHIHCPSSMIANRLKHFKYEPSVFHVISNGVNDYFHKVEVARPEWIKAKYVITSVGRLADEKRQDLLIKAVAASKYNKDIQIILCGSGPNKSEFECLAKQRKIANKIEIKFCNQEELRNILNYSDLYVHTADYEIEGISCIEAFACGTVPIISDSKDSATNAFAISDRCLFKHGNYKDLKEKIEYLIEHPEETQDLSKRYEEHAKKYLLTQMVSDMENMFLEATQDVKEGKDFPTLNKSKKDKRKAKSIFKKIRRMYKKKGIDFKMPLNLN